MRYVNTHLISELWYIAQILSAPRTYTQRTMAAIVWYIWKGAVFKFPIMALQRPKSMGGWEMAHIEAKCRALLLCHMYIQSRKEEKITAEWMRKWQLTSKHKNPPQRWKTLEKLNYLQVYALDMSYIRYDCTRGSMVKIRQNLYRQLQMMAHARTGTKDMRIDSLYPNT